MKQSFLVFIVLSLCCLGCEESVDGCLDRNAANFDVTAVTACDDCCELPVVSLDVELGYDTLRVVYGTEYMLNDTDSVRVLSFELPLTNFVFYNNSVPSEVIDTILGFASRERDDYVTVSQSTKYEIGHTNFEVDFEGFSCILGYDQSALESLKPYIDIASENKVVQFVRNFHNDTIDSYSQLNMILQMEDSTRNIQVTEISEALKQINFDANVVSSRGLDWEVEMRIDLKKVLAGVTPILTDSEIAELIGQNLSASVMGN